MGEKGRKIKSDGEKDRKTERKKEI
jgi:hypothetical protein